METTARLAEGLAKRRRFTVEEYHKMGEVGILGEDERVELSEGEVVEMNPIGWRHVEAVDALNGLLSGWSAGRHRVSVQNPVVLHEGVEHQPDLMLLRSSSERMGRLPTAADVLLVVEVADTSLRYDREVKLPLYARVGIAETWVVDLQGEAIERHNDPSEGGYRRMERVGRGRTLVSEVLSDLVLHAGAVLG